MLSTEQHFFLSVLADYLNGKATESVAGLDWRKLSVIAERHQLSALLYAQCGAFLPPEIELDLLSDYGAAVSDYIGWQSIAADIEREFTRCGISYVIVKGLVVAQYYPEPDLRPMGDLDIVVREEEKERACECLLKAGFHINSKSEHEWNFWKDRYAIELHHRLLYEEPANTPQEIVFTDRIWEHLRPIPGSSRLELEPEFHFLFLLLHLKKHIVNSGVGFRQYMDLAVAAGKWSLDWSKVEEQLTQLDMLTFFKISLTFCRRWFQLQFPIAEVELEPDFEQEETCHVFNNGIFGFDDDSNSDNYTIAELEFGEGDSVQSRMQICLKALGPASPKLRKVMFTQFWQVLFPRYEFLINLKYYRFLEGRPWLLPVAWLYRLVLGVQFKCKRIYSLSMFSREKVSKRRKRLKKLGL